MLCQVCGLPSPTPVCDDCDGWVPVHWRKAALMLGFALLVTLGFLAWIVSLVKAWRVWG